jgi:hypothetical protein
MQEHMPMRNSPLLPALSLLVATVLGLHASLTAGRDPGPPTELQLGEIALALTLAIFGLQGLISVVIEGQELEPGRVPERLTGTLSVGILLLSLVLFGLALALAYGIADDWQTRAIGSIAGAGCLVLATLLVFYKEAFVGDEANFDDRDDGVPW